MFFITMPPIIMTFLKRIVGQFVSTQPGLLIFEFSSTTSKIVQFNTTLCVIVKCELKGEWHAFITVAPCYKYNVDEGRKKLGLKTAL